MKKIAILGSTGSIGTQTLDVVRANGDIEVLGISAGKNIQKLEEQVNSLNCAKKENQIAPENAYVSFSNSEFTIVPETEGSELNAVKEVLAYEVTKLIHGEEEAAKAQEGARALFGSGANTDNMPSTTFTAADFADGQLGILDMLMFSINPMYDYGQGD